MYTVFDPELGSSTSSCTLTVARMFCTYCFWLVFLMVNTRSNRSPAVTFAGSVAIFSTIRRA